MQGLSGSLGHSHKILAHGFHRNVLAYRPWCLFAFLKRKEVDTKINLDLR
ncbi:hypothetical protein JCM19231_1124 [Vibrio ishigakensis]|uniref:Uncharacterized protein n=1 Tax=Vibrio ishigakensis TaxID=1481914 RepID=A0A0B8P8M4_9VIBR|nr:hypothetical protein JCM19231_1124 [Vibrio ishigakensis]